MKKYGDRLIVKLAQNKGNAQCNTRNAIEQMRKISKVPGVTKNMIKDWISEGRR